LLKPASEGTGLIAGTAVRTYLDLAGVHDILAKSLGSSNILNVMKAVRQGLMSLRRADHIANLRGKNVDELIGRKGAQVFFDSKYAVLSTAYPEVARRRQEDKTAREAAPPPVEEATPDLQEDITAEAATELPPTPEAAAPLAEASATPAAEAPAPKTEGDKEPGN